MKDKRNVLGLIGDTPIIRLNKSVPEGHAQILAKLESFNPGGSVKDRIALAMIEDAEKKGELKQGKIIIEPTSGNTGIGLALVAASKGYDLVLTMPETMSIERRKLLKMFGAEIVLTPGPEGMVGTVKAAKELLLKNKNYVIMGQFDNEANPRIHYETTGPEIWDQVEGNIDVFVSGIGTGGTITGVARYLKEKGSKAKIIGLEPKQSPVLSGGESGPHKIQGIGAGFVPKVLDRELIDEIMTIDEREAILQRKRLYIDEGLSVGISSGAAVAGAIKVADKIGTDKIVVVILPDIGERYLSMWE